MRLGRLLDALEHPAEAHGDRDLEVRALSLDSRDIIEGTLFACIRGSRVDGHDHAKAAVTAGATALLVDHLLGLAAAEIVVADVRAALGPVAAAFHGHPSRSLEVVGITGTNGKTTTTELLRAILDADGRQATALGTLHSRPGAPPTTPDAPELQAQLAAALADGRRAVVMEVSSHALAQHRVDGTRFAVAVFTNLTQDHLDYHATMEDYFAAKARLFEPDLAERAVVNVDDVRGRLLRDSARVPTTTYGLADVAELEVGVLASTGRWRGKALEVPIGGAHNVSNALAALTTAVELGVDEATALEALAAAPVPPGRLDPVDAGQPFTVVVDYAHTPDGIEQALRAARAGSGRVIAVFGAGGDKDREKRPLMGDAAGRLADVIVLTADNPRSENPLAIIEAIRGGIRSNAAVRVEPDRRAAIALALAEARPGDVVVVAGKGHETTQELADRTIPFDDRVVVREELDRL